MKDPSLLNPLTLAFLGDAIYEVYVRRKLILEGKIHPGRLHKEAIRFVKATSQRKQLDVIRERLEEDEESIVRRAKNAKPGHIPKNTETMDYMLATAFEALIGYLYLTGKKGRMEWMIEEGIRWVVEEEDGS